MNNDRTHTRQCPWTANRQQWYPTDDDNPPPTNNERPGHDNPRCERERAPTNANDRPGTKTRGPAPPLPPCLPPPPLSPPYITPCPSLPLPPSITPHSSLPLPFPPLPPLSIISPFPYHYFLPSPSFPPPFFTLHHSLPPPFNLRCSKIHLCS